MDTTTAFIVLIACAAFLLILYFIIRQAVADGVKKSSKLIATLLFRQAEKQGVNHNDLTEINKDMMNL
jgi:hypothetical protein